jgi:hypothetical protein
MSYRHDTAIILTAFHGFQGVKSKNKLILRLMDKLVYPNPAAYRDQLIRFSQLNHTIYSEVGHALYRGSACYILRSHSVSFKLILCTILLIYLEHFD